MQKNKVLDILFWLSTASLALMSSTILLIPLVSNPGPKTIWFYVVGASFWTFLLLGYSLLIAAAVVRKKNCKDENAKKLPGIISFFSNIPATIADVVLILSVIAMIIVYITDLTSGYTAFIVLFLMVVSLNMHSLFNGKIYKTLTINFKKEKIER